jgi:hypothetical protein
MFRSHVRISFRNLSKHKLYAIINGLGLTLGLAACLVIYLVVSYEFGFDNFHPGKKSIYRVVSIKTTDMGEARPQSGAPAPLPAAVNARIPGIDEIAGFYPYKATIRVPSGSGPATQFENKAAYGNNSSTIITDGSYFKVFHYDWLAGNAASALKKPFEIILTQTSAARFFGSLSPDQVIGRQVIFNDSLKLYVSGVVKDWKGHTDFPFAEFISSSTVNNSFLKSNIRLEEWGNGDNPAWQVFVKLSGNVNPSSVSKQLSALTAGNMKLEPGEKFRITFQPLSAIHFDTGVDDGLRKASEPVLYSLMGIALFILLIAVINFINLSTAQFSERAKETGIRKILGSSRKTLMLQFLSETFLLTLFACLITLLLIRPILAVFHNYIPQGLFFEINIPVILFVAVLIVFTTLLAGLYPARVLSAYSPVLILKGAGVKTGKDYLRKGLIIFQFTISLVFIICAILVGNQLRYMLRQDFGFNADAVLKVNTNMGDMSNKKQVFAEKLLQLPDVKEISFQSFPPMGDQSAMIPLKYKADHELEMPVKLQAADEHFIPLYQVKILAGRNMVHSDSISEFVINQSFAKALGFTDAAQAIGKLLYLGDRGYPVVGVVADFHQASYREPISPQVILSLPVAESGIAIKLAPVEKEGRDYRESLNRIEKAWKSVYPGEPFDAVFLDEYIARLYEQEQKTAWLVRFTMMTTIFISCIGLLGLSVFLAQKRTKEIGIRKVLGATVVQITAMLCRDFLVLVALALLIASPIGAYLMHRWLQGYAYRVGINWWTFAIAGTAALTIALLTVIIQSVRAGLANPVKSLRNE